jgi:spore germination protein GerM
MRPRRGVLFLLIAAGLSVGCGVSTEQSARLERDSDVPFSLLSPATSTAGPGASTASDAQTDAVAVYFVQADGLVPTPRTGAHSAEELVAALVAGPTADEARLGLRSSLVVPDLVTSAAADGNVAVVELGPSFADVQGREQVLALGQLVFTLTSLPGIDRVRFESEGKTTNVTRADGSSVTGAVSRADYEELLVGG